MARPAALAALAIVLAPAAAAAAPNDFRLNARRNGDPILYTANADGTYSPRDDLFKAFTTELAYVFAPRAAAPAETLGYAGFEVSALWSGTSVSSSQPFWGVTEKAQGGEAPNDFLHTLTLGVRKGLPFSFELGVSMAWLLESELVAPGLELRWAFNEGFSYAPDLSIGAGVTHVVGNRDLNVTVTTLDVVVSKSFGLGGFVNLAPYAGYSLLLVAATSRVINPTPADEGDVGREFVFGDLDPTSNLHHRLLLGVRAVFQPLTLAVEGDFQLLNDTATGTSVFGPVVTITTKLGLAY